MDANVAIKKTRLYYLNKEIEHLFRKLALENQADIPMWAISNFNQWYRTFKLFKLHMKNHHDLQLLNNQAAGRLTVQKYVELQQKKDVVLERINHWERLFINNHFRTRSQLKLQVKLVKAIELQEELRFLKIKIYIEQNRHLAAAILNQEQSRCNEIESLSRILSE